jgi:tousled-like kinase
LKQVLKAQRTLPEREALSIMMQVFAGLRYLSEQSNSVIHYDLKPANILFHSGEVRISDFCLFKAEGI